MALLAIGAVGGAISLATSSSSSSSTPARFSRLSFSRTRSLSAAESSFSLTATTSLSVASLQDALPSSSLGVYCGRGDKKTAKGKRFRHSFGNCRPRNKKRGRGPPRAPMPPSPPKKDKFDDGEIVKIDIDESLFS